MTHAPQPVGGQPHPQHPHPIPHSQPHAQPAQPAQQQPMGMVQFTTQGHFMTSSFIPPRVLMNGFQIAVPNIGTTTVPVPAGPVAIEANQVYIYGPYGQAGLHVTVAPGQTVPVFYAPPYAMWSKGRMGVEPQERQGLGWYIGLLCAIFVVPVGAIFSAIAIALMR